MAARHRASTPPPRKDGGTTCKPVPAAPSRVSPRTAKIDTALLRAGFVRKVYGILSAQLALTVVVAATCTFSQSVRGLFLRTQVGGWLNMLVFLPTMACLAGLHWKKDSYPMNYYFLFWLTLFISLDVGFVCSVLYSAGLGLIVVQAAVITTAMFVGLTAYAFYSGRDFSFMKGFLSCSLWGLVIGGLLSLLLGIHIGDAAMAWFGAAVFCGYILYDTDRLASKLGYDDYIVATAELYLDIINLFLHILKILMGNANQDKKDKKEK